MENNQFITAYSDDLVFLDEFKEAYRTHPFTQGDCVEWLSNPHCIRILSILIVGNIESLIKRWKIETNDFERLEKLLQGGTLGEITNKADKIYDLFNEKQIIIDKKRIIKYLGIKNLRNAIIHSDMNNNKKEILNNNRLPVDINRGDVSIYDQLMDINKTIMQYINEYGLVTLNIDKEYIKILKEDDVTMRFFEKLERVLKHKVEDNDNLFKMGLSNMPKNYKLPYALDIAHISYLLFNNLDRINSDIYKSIEMHNNKKLKKLLDSILYCWREYMNINCKVYFDLDKNKIEKCIENIKLIINDEHEKVNEDEYLITIKYANIFDAYIKNYSVITSFIILLRYVDVNNRKQVAEELQKIILLCKLKEYNIKRMKKTKFPNEMFNKYEMEINNIINSWEE